MEGFLVCLSEDYDSDPEGTCSDERRNGRREARVQTFHSSRISYPFSEFEQVFAGVFLRQRRRAETSVPQKKKKKICRLIVSKL